MTIVLRLIYAYTSTGECHPEQVAWGESVPTMNAPVIVNTIATSYKSITVYWPKSRPDGGLVNDHFHTHY